MITFRNVVGYLETIADKHYEIKSFHSGELDEVDINKLGATDYIILYAEPGTVVVDRGVLTYSFTLYVMDMINDQDLGDSPNNQRLGRVDTYSETLQIMQDVINEFHQSLATQSWVDNEVVLDMPVNLEPFTAKFDNTLTGWSGSINIQVNNANNLCISPIDANT